MKYGISKVLDIPFERAIEHVTEELKKEGFGILTTIDVKETIKKKLDKDFPRYTILGACNPGFAHQALLADDEIGLFLPCNVIVHEKNGRIHVSVFDPAIMGNFSDKISPIAGSVREKLMRVMDRL